MNTILINKTFDAGGRRYVAGEEVDAAELPERFRCGPLRKGWVTPDPPPPEAAPDPPEPPELEAIGMPGPIVAKLHTVGLTTRDDVVRYAQANEGLAAAGLTEKQQQRAFEVLQASAPEGDDPGGEESQEEGHEGDPGEQANPSDADNGDE